MLALVVALSACRTEPEAVCEHIGNCEQGGDSEWIAGCKQEAELAARQAASVGCKAILDEVFACAASKFDCRGATAVFAGCEAKVASFDNCLSRAAANTACAALATKTASCTRTDGGAGDGSSAMPLVPPTCTAERDCQARCFLDSVREVCAPAVDELEAFNACAAKCPGL